MVVLFLIFENEYTYETINGENIDDDLLEVAETLGLNTENSKSNKWFLFSVNYGLNNGLDLISAKSFGDVVTFFMTGVQLDNVGAYYKKEKVIDDVYDLVFEAYDLDEDKEIENVKGLFEDIFTLYDEMYDKYTRKTEQLLIRVSVPVRHKFNMVDGDTAAEKLDNLIGCYENNYKKL